MQVILGFALAFASVIIGFMWSGGKIGSFAHPPEFLMIFGTAAGALFTSTPGPVIKKIISCAKGAFGKSHYDKDFFLKILKMQFDLFQVGRREGSTALEAHVENPKDSSIFQNYPDFLHAPDFVSFYTDTLKIVTGSSISPYDLEDMMDCDIKTQHEFDHKAPTNLANIGDSFPGIGIVAAVCGIIITMGKITAGPEAVGHQVSAALLGTLVGVWTAYGFVGPLSKKIDSDISEHGRVFSVLKIGILNFAKGAPPAVAVEFARRAIYQTVRPSFVEVEEACRGQKAAE